MNKRILTVSIFLIFLAAGSTVIWNTGYLQRWYGICSDRDRIQVFLYQGNEVIPCQEYSLQVTLDDQSVAVKQQKEGYSIWGGEYGTYIIDLTWLNKAATLKLWNTNNWWRTTIVLRVLDDGSGLEQINNVYNNDPPFIEVQTVSWK